MSSGNFSQKGLFLSSLNFFIFCHSAGSGLLFSLGTNSILVQIKRCPLWAHAALPALHFCGKRKGSLPQRQPQSSPHQPLSPLGWTCLCSAQTVQQGALFPVPKKPGFQHNTLNTSQCWALGQAVEIKKGVRQYLPLGSGRRSM